MSYPLDDRRPAGCNLSRTLRAIDHAVEVDPVALARGMDATDADPPRADRLP
jgi:hypothetical protein